MARLTKPHGLKGGLRLEMYTDRPELRFVPGAQFSLQVPKDSPWFEQTITLSQMRTQNGQSVAFFHEVPDRTAAESIARAILWIDESVVRPDEEEDAWFDRDLVGLSVVRDGRTLGTVREVQHFPAQDLLAVATGQGTVLVPLVKAIVPRVDLAAGIVEVTPPEGLFSTLTDEE